jgi:membrane protein implicated in regulation of membrane protease activity
VTPPLRACVPPSAFRRIVRLRHRGGVVPLRWLLLLVGGFLALAGAPGATAQPLDYAIEFFEARLTMDDAGDFDVVERIRFRVEGGSFSTGYRRIPLGRRAEVVAVEVFSPDVDIENVRDRRVRGDLVLEWSFPERTASATFEIRYRVTGGLLEAEGENRIDWEPVGDAWEVPLEAVRIVVAWPDLGLQREDIRLAPPEEGTLSRTANGWEATFSPGSLAAGESWAMAVGFPRRIDGRSPPVPVKGSALVLGLLAAALAGILPGLAIGRRLRPPPVSPRRGVPAPPRTPLPEATLLAHGNMYWPSRLFPALLVSLARRGQVTLAREREEGEGAGVAARERLQVTRVPTADRSQPETDLTSLETGFLSELERHETFEEFMTRGTAFYRSAREATGQRLESGGWILDRRRRASLLLAGGGAVLVAGVAALVAMVRVLELPAHVTVPWLVFILLAGIGLMLGGARRRDLTPEGAEARAEVLDWQTHLREEIGRRLERDPEGATRVLLDGLEWILADPRADSAWMQSLEARLREAGVAFELPPWIRSATGSVNGSGDTMVPSFLPIYLLGVMSTPGGHATGSSMSTGFPAGGVGATGSFGGGGGGIR